MKTDTISPVTYNTFVGQVSKHQVQQLTLRPCNRIDYRLKSEFGNQRHATDKPADITDDIPAILQVYGFE